MVFRRRDRRGILKILWNAIYPKGGWARAYEYVKHRLRRLPGTPEQIARGVFAGVFTSFTPFYGMHFIVAAIVAVASRGSVLAALLGTFFGNPLTYVPIGAVSLWLGNLMLGREASDSFHGSFGRKFFDAGADLWYNFLAIFTSAEAEWAGLFRFWDKIFLPWLVGGIIPGVITGVIFYYLSVPVIRVYKNRRKGRFAERLAELRQKAKLRRDDDTTGDT